MQKRKSIPNPPRTDYLTPRLRAKPKKKRHPTDKNLADCVGFTANLVADDYDDVEET
jgi:hypothetical protein